MIATNETVSTSRDAEQWVTDIFPFVQRIAKRHGFYGVESDDIAQEAIIRLYQWFGDKLPESETECRKMASACVNRASADLYKWSTRKSRDYRREIEYQDDSVAFTSPRTLRAGKSRSDDRRNVELEEIIEKTDYPEAYRMRLAGYEVREIAEILGGTEKQWRYKMRKQLAKVMQVA